MVISNFLRDAQQWFSRTPERALRQAYEAAQTIQTIEREYFGGNPISSRYGDYGEGAMAYFQEELRKNLSLIRMRLAVFRASRTVTRISNSSMVEVDLPRDATDDLAISRVDRQAIWFRQLQLIDQVLGRYQNLDDSTNRLITLTNGARPGLEGQSSGRIGRSPAGLEPYGGASQGAIAPPRDPGQSTNPNDNLIDRVNVLPRSILRTVDRIRQDLDPNSEQEVIQDFRRSKVRTTGAIRLLLLMVIVPLLTQQFTKTFVVGPVVERLRPDTPADVFLNIEMEEEAFHELKNFEERLRFEALISKSPTLSEEAIEERVREKAAEIEEEYRHRSANALKNVFADLLAAIAFALLLVFRKPEVANLKSFIDEIVYGLSDSAKAFIIILFTDTFVGFHSPHGWEIILEGLSRHLGLPASRDFIFLFIATFPVILDTVFKYWIFRYLNRISPSAVATYKDMNE
ncbi:MAG: proton extrusion protein PcxA [Nodosilinea sp.]